MSYVQTGFSEVLGLLDCLIMEEFHGKNETRINTKEMLKGEIQGGGIGTKGDGAIKDCLGVNNNNDKISHRYMLEMVRCQFVCVSEWVRRVSGRPV